MVRDGRPALVSKQKNSIVLVSPAGRSVQANGRPVFIVGITNITKQPIDFRVAQVEVTQVVNGQAMAMGVITYETLVQEERTRQVAAALLTGLAAGANAYSASRAGYGSFSGTTYSSSGRTYSTSGSFYSPTAAAIAQGNAAEQNEAMISATRRDKLRIMISFADPIAIRNAVAILFPEYFSGEKEMGGWRQKDQVAAAPLERKLKDRKKIDAVRISVSLNSNGSSELFIPSIAGYPEERVTADWFPRTGFFEYTRVVTEDIIKIQAYLKGKAEKRGNALEEIFGNG